MKLKITTIIMIIMATFAQVLFINLEQAKQAIFLTLTKDQQEVLQKIIQEVEAIEFIKVVVTIEDS